MAVKKLILHLNKKGNKLFTTVQEAKNEANKVLVKLRLENPKTTISAAYIKVAKDAGFKSWNDLTIAINKQHLKEGVGYGK